MKKIRKCGRCGAYTLGQECGKCGDKTHTAHPAKYSPEDKWAEYRRKHKFEGG